VRAQPHPLTVQRVPAAQVNDPGVSNVEPHLLAKQRKEQAVAALGQRPFKRLAARECKGRHTERRLVRRVCQKTIEVDASGEAERRE
jgi:hypothetical protein